jgi:large subunit ribosomal protein L20
MRVTNAVASRARRKRMIKAAKGYRLKRSKLYRYASDAVDHARQYAYRDRRTKKRTFRRLWQVRINAATRAAGLSYSRFMEGLKAAQIALDRKVLADLAATDSAAFGELINLAQNALQAKRAAAAAALPAPAPTTAPA